MSRARLAERCRTQALWCDRLGSPLYGQILRDVAADVEAGGPLWEAMRGHADAPEQFYVPIRMLGAVHRLVLTGRAPALAAHYPSVGGTPADGLWVAFRDAVAAHRADVAASLDQPPQTNEVGRAAVLLGGFLEVAHATGQPLRLLEVGASAGLNLTWDRYRYDAEDWSWGEPNSPVRFGGVFSGNGRPSSVPAQVAERAGCDLQPIDPASADGRLGLMSYVWPDQTERFDRLRAALDLAADDAPTVDRADAVTWLGRRLTEARPGFATVVFHSVMLGYLSDGDQRRMAELIDTAGLAASDDRPVARLSFERVGDRFELRLQMWPAGTDQILATAPPHGPPVTWLA